MLKCAVIGLSAGAQQAAFSTEMILPSMPPPVASRPELVASASQIGGNYIPNTEESKNTGMPTEPQAIVQETKNVNAPTEPQAVMQEIKSATRLSSSKQRRRKPKMAGIPDGSQTVAQETKEPVFQVGAQEARKPKMAGVPGGPQTVAQETKEPVFQVGAQEAKKPKMAGVPGGSQTVAQEAKEPESPAGVKKTKEAVSQEVAQEDEAADTLDKSLAATQETKKTAAPSEPEAELKVSQASGPKKKVYAMAPIRWQARLTETIGMGRTAIKNHLLGAGSIAADTSTSRSSPFVNTQTATVGASTFVLQPYIAKVDGNVGVVSSKAGTSYASNSPSSLGKITATSTRNNQLFGRGNLSVFSQSRFPFKMSLGVTNKNDSSGLQVTDSVIKTLLLRQAYKPLGSRSNYTGGYNRETNTSTTVSTARSFWEGGYSTSNTEHRINAAARFNDQATNFDSVAKLTTTMRTDDFIVSDAYLPSDSLLSLNAFGNINLFTDGTRNTRYVLANTNATWQPEDEDIPLFVEGNVHFFDQLQTSQGYATKSQSLGTKVATRYLFSNILTGRASGELTSTTDNGNRNLITKQLGSIAYTPTSISLWKNASYSWNALGGAANDTASTGPGNSSIFGNAAQSLNVPYPLNVLGKKLSISSGINQSLAALVSRTGGQAFTLNNGATVSLGSLLAAVPNKDFLGGHGKFSGGAGTTATLYVNDRRVYGTNPSRSQTVNLKFDINSKESGRVAYEQSGLTVEAGVEAVQGTMGNSTQLVGVGSATYSYRKARAFNVRGLDYTGTAHASRQTNFRNNNVASATDPSVAFAAANANNPSFPWKIDQGLSYKVGQNSLTLTGSLSDASGVKNASLWLLFRAWRTTGN